jgi:hypothetical protein
MLILIAENIYKEEETNKTFSIKLSRFSHLLNASECERNFQTFFGTLEIRWRQLSWASIAVRENQTAAFRSGLLQMIPLQFSQISSKIRKFPGHKLYLSSPLQNANFAGSFCGLFESGLASVNLCRLDEITKRIAALKFLIIEKKNHENIQT